MSEVAESAGERGRRHGAEIAAMWRSGPHEPLATREQVLEIGCTACGAAPGAECDTKWPHPAFAAGMTFGTAMRDVHMRRYLDKTGDPR